MAEHTNKKLIVIGAPKSGTTSLAIWLDQHPAIKLGVIKEPRYFTNFKEQTWSGPTSDYFAGRLATDREQYEALYENEKGAEWGLDASTDYLSCETSAGLIEEFAKAHTVKLICVLRDPVDRAYSEYAHTIRQDLQRKTFLQSLELESKRIEKGWIPLFYHARRSRYGAGLRRFCERFDSRSRLILPFEDLRNNEATLARIEKFIGLDPHEYDTAKVHNVSSAARSRVIKSLITTDNALKRMVKRVLPSSARSFVKNLNDAKLSITADEAMVLYDRLKDDIALAQSLTPFDAGHWTRR